MCKPTCNLCGLPQLLRLQRARLTEIALISERIVNDSKIMINGNSGTTHVPSIVTCSGLSCV